ncbi:MAG: hypothetical protein ACKOE2_13745 [Actinomycetales bacterium]
MSQPVANWISVGLLALTAVGTVVIVLSARASRRMAAAVAGTAWAAAVMSWWTVRAVEGDVLVCGALALAVTAFWLVDRGIPGNRRRPLWFTIFAVAMVLLAVVSLVVVVQAVNAAPHA